MKINFPNGTAEIDPSQPLIVLGANGSGKTKLCLEICESNKDTVTAVSSYNAQNFDLNRELGSARGDMEIKALVSGLGAVLSRILINKKLVFDSGAVCVSDVSGGAKVLYPLNRLSDGEKAMVFYAYTTLVLKPESVLIADEPELHMRRSVCSKLWDRLEALRPDAAFIYITHDMDFAVSRNSAAALKVGSYSMDENGNERWEYEFINTDDYPEFDKSALYEILGGNGKFILSEGTKDSLDYMLYSEIYGDKGFSVIPCGGCQQVMKIMRAKKRRGIFADMEIYGVIDRDFRTDAEVLELSEDGVFCLKVAEVENLFLVPELLRIMQIQLGCESDALANAEELIRSIYSAEILKQAAEAFKIELNKKIGKINFIDGKLGSKDVEEYIYSEFSEEKIRSLFESKKRLYSDAKTIDDVLKIFNYKDLSKRIGSKFGLGGGDYPKRVINLLKNDSGAREKIISAIAPYLPEFGDYAQSDKRL